VNGRSLGSRTLVLNLHSPRDGGCLLRIVVDPHWPHGLDNKPSNKYPIDHEPRILSRNERGRDIANWI